MHSTLFKLSFYKFYVTAIQGAFEFISSYLTPVTDHICSHFSIIKADKTIDIDKEIGYITCAKYSWLAAVGSL